MRQIIVVLFVVVLSGCGGRQMLQGEAVPKPASPPVMQLRDVCVEPARWEWRNNDWECVPHQPSSVQTYAPAPVQPMYVPPMYVVPPLLHPMLIPMPMPMFPVPGYGGSSMYLWVR